MKEGVTKFRAQHREEPLSPRQFAEAARELAAWRRILRDLGLVGADPARYDGYGFGNLSLRVGAPSSPRGRRAFLVTCTQTGELESVGLDDLALVTTYDLDAICVDSQGLCRPSSEALTHGAFYDLSPTVRAVFHVHASSIWNARHALGLPTSAESVPYGTPEMARSVATLMRSTALWEQRIMAMGGHEDGIVAFGKSPREAGQALVTTLARAYGAAVQS